MENKPFSVSVGAVVLNWYDILDNPESYDPEQISEWSARWETCGCGQLDVSIPRIGNTIFEKGKYAPRDNELYELGTVFHEKVCIKDYETARSTLELIKEREKQLLDG